MATGLAQLARNLEKPIWGGELNSVIGERLTLGLPSFDVRIQTVAAAQDPAYTVVVPVPPGIAGGNDR